MREKIGTASVIRERIRQHGADLTWYIDGLRDTLSHVDTHAEENVDIGLVRMAAIRSYNEHVLGWGGYDDTHPMASVLLSREMIATNRSIINTRDILDFIFTYHAYFAKLGITHRDLLDYPFHCVADLRMAFALEEAKHAADSTKP